MTDYMVILGQLLSLKESDQYICKCRVASLTQTDAENTHKPRFLKGWDVKRWVRASALRGRDGSNLHGHNILNRQIWIPRG